MGEPQTTCALLNVQHRYFSENVQQGKRQADSSTIMFFFTIGIFIHFPTVLTDYTFSSILFAVF
jgi:hypothetical protein